MIRKLWYVWPRPWIVLGVLLTCGGFLLLQFSLNARFALALIPLVSATIGYGFFRVSAFHPMGATEYRQFLAISPWTGREPLPQGPIHLVWQDVIMLSAMTALALLSAWLTPPLALCVPLAFAFTYLMGIARNLWIGEINRECFLILAGLALVVRMSPYPVLMLVALGSTYLIAFIGLRRHLLSMAMTDSSELFSTMEHAGSTPKAIVAWPYKQLFPQETFLWPSKGGTLAFAALVGWLFYVMAWIPGVVDDWELYLTAAQYDLTPAQVNELTLDLQDNQRSEMGALGQAIYWYLLVPIFILYIALFIGPFRAPISLIGRLWTGPLLVPGYDRVFFAPAATLVVAIFLPMALQSVGVPPLGRYPISVVVVMLTLRNLAPNLAEWQLTGEHRLSPGMLFSRESFFRG